MKTRYAASEAAFGLQLLSYVVMKLDEGWWEEIEEKKLFRWKKFGVCGGKMKGR